MTDPAGSNTFIQYNDSGVFGASSDFTWDDDAKELAVDITGGATFVVGGSSNYIFMRDGADEPAMVVVADGDVTCVDGDYAGFELSNGTATFLDGVGDTIEIDASTGSITIIATSSSTSAFEVSAGTSGIDAATLGGVLVIGGTPGGDPGASLQKINDVEFDVDFSHWDLGTVSCKNSLSFASTPEDGYIDAQATFADAYGGQLFIQNGKAVLYDWRYNLFDGSGSWIYVGEPFSTDGYAGNITLGAASDDDAVAEQITLTPGTGTSIDCQKLGFFGTAPVGLQLVPNHTAVGGSFDDDTAAMLNAVYAALLNYGLIGYV